MDYLQEYGFHWFWYGLSMLLLALEAVFGRRFALLAVSVAAMVVGGLSHLYPRVNFGYQWMFFAVLAGVLVWIAGSMLREQEERAKRLRRLHETQAYVGRELTLSAAIIDGRGSETIDGLDWDIIGADCPAGSRVRVVSMGNRRLNVEPSTVASRQAVNP